MIGNNLKVLVCGGRKFSDRDALFYALDKFSISKIINGGADGADRLSTLWAKSREIDFKEYPADWSKGKAAGIIRNAEMLKEEKIDLVIAFPGGNGTKDMVERSKRAGVEVVEVEIKVSFRSSFKKEESIVNQNT